MTRVAHVLLALVLAASPALTRAAKPRPRRDTWYEQALRQINPKNVDYGSIWEQRKRVFLGQLENRYFQYSAGATLAYVLLLMVTLVQRMNHKRVVEAAAQSIADVIRHDEYSRQVAREAIRRYNDHIEACNRGIEARHESLSKSASSTESELQRVQKELADTRDENKGLRNDAAGKPRTIADTAPRPAIEQEPPAQTDEEPAHARYIAQINALRKQLRAEQRKNQNLKGTSVDDHRA